MRRTILCLSVALSLFTALAGLRCTVSAQAPPSWHETRQLPSDIEISGELAGAPAGAARYVTREELLAMPQVSFAASDDTNFTQPAKISGVALEELLKRMGGPGADMVLAICDDNYLAPYPPAYLAAHHPVLVLTVNGQPPEGWPKAAEDHASDMGPYMISNPEFTPSFKVLAHEDEAQIPWGVVRLEVREEKTILGAIAPRGPHAKLQPVEDGFQIAQQNCFRCHNAGSEGGKKSGVSWEALAALAANSPQHFAAYIRSPLAEKAGTQMPGNPQYDEATLRALTLYFQTFAVPMKP